MPQIFTAVGENSEKHSIALCGGRTRITHNTERFAFEILTQRFLSFLLIFNQACRLPAWPLALLASGNARLQLHRQVRDQTGERRIRRSQTRTNTGQTLLGCESLLTSSLPTRDVMTASSSSSFAGICRALVLILIVLQ